MFTLVQHSGWAAAGKWDFKNAVELRTLSGTSAEDIRKAGGLIFDTYSEASIAEHNENYPPELKGMIPRVNGSFSNKEVQGQKLYIPEVK